MGGQSQKRHSQHKCENLFKKGRGAGKKRPPPQEPVVVVHPPPQVPQGLPMSAQAFDAEGMTCLPVAEPSEGAPPRTSVQQTIRGGPATNPACTCKCNPERLDKKPVELGCNHVTPRVDASRCNKCTNPKSHRSHHIGCAKSEFFDKTHGRIKQLQQDAQAISRDGTKPGAKPRASDAKGLKPISTFFGGGAARAPARAPRRRRRR